MTAGSTGPGRSPRGGEYSYSRTYMRRRRYRHILGGWPGRHRTFTMLAGAFVVLLAYTAACALVVDRLFPSMAGAYWIAGLALAALATLLALVLWARRE